MYTYLNLLAVITMHKFGPNFLYVSFDEILFIFLIHVI